ncbi:diacylglycerol O-acyltransferase 1, partial [Cladochytrium tenue]
FAVQPSWPSSVPAAARRRAAAKPPPIADVDSGCDLSSSGASSSSDWSPSDFSSVETPYARPRGPGARSASASSGAGPQTRNFAAVAAAAPAGLPQRRARRWERRHSSSDLSDVALVRSSVSSGGGAQLRYGQQRRTTATPDVVSLDEAGGDIGAAEAAAPMPPETWLQAVAITTWMCVPLVLGIMPSVLLVVLLFFYPALVGSVLILYISYAWLLDGDAHERGGWGTTMLYCLGTYANITGNPREFQRLFPGLKIVSTTLPINFRLPLWRELALNLGFVSCTWKSLVAVLRGGDTRSHARKRSGHQQQRHAEGGTSLLLMVGGAEEYTTMESGTLDLVVRKRKGFVRLAVATGADLVPVLTFGENELFEQNPSPLMEALSRLTRRLAHFALPSVRGRRMWWFPPSLAVPLPFRARLVTVVGRPIRVAERVAAAAAAEAEAAPGGGGEGGATAASIDARQATLVDALHAEYMRELEALYVAHRDQYFAY